MVTEKTYSYYLHAFDLCKFLSMHIQWNCYFKFFLQPSAVLSSFSFLITCFTLSFFKRILASLEFLFSILLLISASRWRISPWIWLNLSVNDRKFCYCFHSASSRELIILTRHLDTFIVKKAKKSWNYFRARTTTFFRQSMVGTGPENLVFCTRWSYIILPLSTTTTPNPRSALMSCTRNSKHEPSPWKSDIVP